MSNETCDKLKTAALAGVIALSYNLHLVASAAKFALDTLLPVPRKT